MSEEFKSTEGSEWQAPATTGSEISSTNPEGLADPVEELRQAAYKISAIIENMEVSESDDPRDVKRNIAFAVRDQFNAILNEKSASAKSNETPSTEQFK